MKVWYKKKDIEKRKIVLEERLMDLVEASQDLDFFSAIYFDAEIIGILEELEQLERL